MAILSVSQVAARLKVTRGRVHQFIAAGRLRARKVGAQYVIDDRDVKGLEVKKPGRPRKADRAA